MAGLSNKIAVEVCGKQGHKVESLPATPIVNAASGASYPKYETACIRCGLDLKSLRAKRVKPNGEAEEGEGGDAA